jgi:hypothetical protein
MKKFLIRLFRPCTVHTIQDPVIAYCTPEGVELGREFTCKRCGYVQTTCHFIPFAPRAIVIGRGS